jgi:glycosyltransferase involved in cell wall biosynthesis
VQLLYWICLHYGFSQAVRMDEIGAPSGTVPISVVIAARDEELYLASLLDALERQSHPEYEVIVVDDGSSDGTAEIVRTRMDRQPGLRLVRSPGAGKKAALFAGIAAASHETLAFTDADCLPPPGWLAAISDHHSATGGCVIVGYSPFPHRPGILSRLAGYETFVTGFLTAAAIGLDRPYMAVGRNLSYSKTVFNDAGGFSAIGKSLSGDDDLFLQQVVRRKSARVLALLDRRSFVTTDAPNTFPGWVRQKRRHVSGGRFYSGTIKAHLSAFHGTNLLLWLAPLALGWPGAGLLAAKLLVQAMVLRRAAAVLGEEDQIRLQPILEPLYVLYNVLIAPIGLARVPKRW